MRTKSDPVEMPAQFVDYWIDRATEYQGMHPVPCDYCDEPIERGDRFFVINAMSNEPMKRGHISHLKHAPEHEFVLDPAKRVLQPWEEDPSIEAPPDWETWKEKHRGTLYG